MTKMNTTSSFHGFRGCILQCALARFLECMFEYLIALGDLFDGLLKVGLEHSLVAVGAGVQWGLAECSVAVGVFPDVCG